jgi:hypothetical protein
MAVPNGSRPKKLGASLQNAKLPVIANPICITVLPVVLSHLPNLQ